MPIFEKLPQILGLCPLVKFRSTPEKSDPPKHFVDPPQAKNPAQITGSKPKSSGGESIAPLK